MGTPSKVYDGLEAASLHGFLEATKEQGQMIGGVYSALGSYIENDGTCYKNDKTKTDKGCSFSKRAIDERCCDATVASMFAPNTYCKATGADCIDVSPTEHYQSEGCAADERCVPSFLTMGSPSGLLFGITNIVGNFGTVFVDQSYWQSAVAAKPKSAVLGFLIGGMVWFAVPFCMATTNGLAGRAITTHAELGPLYLDAGASGSGLTPARVLAHVLGSGGAFILLLQLFMAITSTGSAEIIAVSSILTYDVYYEYINPELKHRREALRSIFYSVVQNFDVRGQVAIDSVQSLMNRLVERKFFENAVPAEEVALL